MPALPHHVEPSAFHRGEYVAYGPGGAWSLRKHGCGGWEAFAPRGYAANGGTPCYLRGRTLAEVAARLL